MDLTLSFYIVAACAVLITGISKGGFGGGLGIMAVPLMSLYITPQLAAAILMPILLAMDIIIVWHYRASWNRTIVMMLLPGAILGIAIGALTFQWMSPDAIRFSIGILALFFIGQFLWNKYRKTEMRPTARIVVLILGTVSGFSSYIAHAGGPPVKGILLREGMEKSTFVGTNTILFFIINAIKTISYGALGQMNSESLKISIIFAPVVLVGIALGTVMHKFVSQASFTKIVYTLMLATGLKLIWDGRGVLGF